MQELQQWQNFFARSLQRNLDLKPYNEALRRQSSRSYLKGLSVLKAWAAIQDRGFVVKPRYMRYFESLLHLHIITDEDALSFVAINFKETIGTQDKLLIMSGVAKGEYKPTIEAAMLERLAYQMVNFRGATVPLGDRIPSIRILKPLVSLLSAFHQALGGSAPLNGPALEIAIELGKFVAAYINDLSLLGLLDCENGGPPQGLTGTELCKAELTCYSVPEGLRPSPAFFCQPSRPYKLRTFRIS